MKYARARIKGKLCSGPYDPAREILFGEAESGSRLPASALHVSMDRLALPVSPGKIICIGKNYLSHAVEMGGEIPNEPLFFLVAPSALIGPGEPIRLPHQSGEVHFEGELALIIGDKCRSVRADAASGFIFGYTIMNDVTARDLQRSDGQWARAKSFDTFCPLGPWVDTAFEPSGQRLITRVNGKVRQDSPLTDMAFSVWQLIEHVSAAMTLHPGDVIGTGTPAGVGAIAHGDYVEIEIEGLGKLGNPVEREVGE